MKQFTNLSLFAGCMTLAAWSFGQEITNYETVFYVDVPSTEVSKGVNVDMKNIVATATSAKFALKIENNSSDIIIFNPHESAFVYDFGDMHSTDKELIIAPEKNKNKVINFSGTDKFRQEKFNFKTSGFYIVPVEGNTVKADDFQLPAARNNFTAGNFEVELKSYKASTAEARAIFEVTYKGDRIGLVNSANLSVRAKRNKSEEEVTYANDDKKSDVELLRKGDKVKFNAVFHIEGRIVDMQFATMYIVWNDTFIESEAEAVEPVLIPVTWDPGVTNAKK